MHTGCKPSPLQPGRHLLPRVHAEHRTASSLLPQAIRSSAPIAARMRMAPLFFTRYWTHRLSAARLLASTSAQFAQRTEHLSRLPDPLHNVVPPPPPPPPEIASQPPGFASAPPPTASPPPELPPRRRWESPPPVPGVASARPTMAQTRVGKR